MTVSESQIGMVGTRVHRLAAVDERQAVLVHGLEDQLDADEREDHREPDATGRPAA